MARITVEDCITKVPDRFELVILAGQRAKEIGAGSPLTVERDNDKNPVVALREIAENTVNTDDLRNALINLHRQYAQAESHEDELEDLLEQELSGVQHITDAHVRSVMEEKDSEEESAEFSDVEDENDNNSEKDSSLYEDADIVDE